MIFQGKKKADHPDSRFSDERELISLATGGNEAACEEIFRRNKDRVFSLCCRIAGDFHTAEDILQESFLKVFRSLGRFRHDSSLATWIYRVAVNTAIEHLRRLRRGQDLFPESTAETDWKEWDSGNSASATRNRSWEILDLERAVADLPQGYRVVFVLHDVEGWEHQEIAALLGCSEGTSKSQLSKARWKIRQLLQGQENGEEKKQDASHNLIEIRSWKQGVNGQ